MKRINILLIIILSCNVLLWGQDCLPNFAITEKANRTIEPAISMETVKVDASSINPLPFSFIGTKTNELNDKNGSLNEVWNKLKSVKNGFTNDTICIVHIGDSHIRGRIFPQTTGELLNSSFRNHIKYVDNGINGATCKKFCDPKKIKKIADLIPDMLIVSFGTNEGYTRRYSSRAHLEELNELYDLLRSYMPHVPIIMTTPCGTYMRKRGRRYRRNYIVNPTNPKTVDTICKFAEEKNIPVWNLYEIAGGKGFSCQNWYGANLMRPDHIHFFAEGYKLQGTLLYNALIKSYNAYVSF